MSKRLYTHGEDAELHLKQVPLDELHNGFVRILPKALAMNPIDYKLLKARSAVGSGIGCDFAGVVTHVAPDVTSIQVGDTVAGGVVGNDRDHKLNGAFSDSLILPADSLLKFSQPLVTDNRDYIPCGPVRSFEQASSLGICVGTPVLATEYYNNIPFKKNIASGYALVYGASSSLGYNTCQAYKWMGYEVIAIASNLHRKLFEEIGVKHLFDYHEQDWVDQVRKITGDDLTLAYDTISNTDTLKQVYKCVSTTVPSKIYLSLLLPEEVRPKIREGVSIDVPVWYQFWNTSFYISGAWIVRTNEDFHRRRASIFDDINIFLQHVKCLPIRVSGNSLEAVPNALKVLERGVSGEKVVVRI